MINILVRVTIRAAIFQTDCNRESRCFASELQLSNIEVIKAWKTILALSSSIYFVIWVTTQTYKPYTATHVFFEPINAIIPFEQVHAVPDLEFLARFQRQRGREIIKEQSWWFGCGPRQAVKLNLRGNHSLGEEDCGFCQLSTWPFGWEWDGSKGIPIWIDSLGSMNDRSRNRICTLIWM